MSLFINLYNASDRGNKLSATVELHCRSHILLGEFLNYDLVRKQKLQSDQEGMITLAVQLFGLQLGFLDGK